MKLISSKPASHPEKYDFKAWAVASEEVNLRTQVLTQVVAVAVGPCLEGCGIVGTISPLQSSALIHIG